MSSTYGSLNIALTALRSMQRAIEVVGHNVSNAATPGYARQAALLVANDPYSVPTTNRDVTLGQVGTGVSVGTIQQYRSAYLDNQMRNETLLLNGWQVREEVLGQIEVMLNEPSDTGLATYLSEFWASWSELSSYPSSTAAREEVVASASALSATLREVHRQMTDLQTELDDRLSSQVQTVNDIAKQLAELNETINDVEALGQEANDLRDRRTGLLSELAGIININAYESETGSVMVSIGGQLLVQDEVYTEIALEMDPNNSGMERVVWSDDGDTVNVEGIALDGGLTQAAGEILSGELGATLVARDLILTEKMAELDTIANALIEYVNGLHQTGYGLEGAEGGAVTGQDIVAGTVDGFTMVPPLDGNGGLSATEHFVEIRDNGGTLEFRLVNSSGDAVDIVDAAAGDGSLTGDWQSLDLVDGTSFDTGRGLEIDFAAIADHSLGAAATDSNVTGFGLGGVVTGNDELDSDTYYVEVRDNAGVAEFRLVDSGGNAVSIYDDAAGDGTLTDAWQTIPTLATFDTQRGLRIDFSGGPFTATTFGGTPTPANATYAARGTQTGTREGGAASVTLGNFFSGTGASDIAVSDYITSDTSRVVSAAADDSAGDGSISLAISRLQDEALLNDNTTTIDNFYTAAVSSLGTESAHASTMSSHHQLLFDHLNDQQQAISGVSLDEESVDLIQFQRTYQAAARVLTTLDEMLDKVINGMGVVGR